MCYHVKTFCCGFSNLDIGCKTIAIAEMVIALVITVVSIFLAVEWSAFAAIPLVVTLPTVALSFTLLHGVKTRDPEYLMGWLKCQAILIAVHCVSVIVCIVFACQSIENQPDSKLIVYIWWVATTAVFIITAVQIYFHMVVYSYLEEIEYGYWRSECTSPQLFGITGAADPCSQFDCCRSDEPDDE